MKYVLPTLAGLILLCPSAHATYGSKSPLDKSKLGVYASLAMILREISTRPSKDSAAPSLGTKNLSFHSIGHSTIGKEKAETPAYSTVASTALKIDLESFDMQYIIEFQR